MGLALGFKSSSETERSNPYGEPSELIGDTNEILKPGPELTRADEACSKAESRNSRCSKNSYPGNSVPIQFPEEFRGMAIDS